MRTSLATFWADNKIAIYRCALQHHRDIASVHACSIIVPINLSKSHRFFHHFMENFLYSFALNVQKLIQGYMKFNLKFLAGNVMIVSKFIFVVWII